MVTLKDVAKQANVSIATVSRAITQPHKLSCQTLEKIEIAFISTGYNPNIRHRKTPKPIELERIILCLVNNQHSYVNKQILKGIFNQHNGDNCYILVCDFQNKKYIKLDEVSRLIRKNHTDFIFVIGKDLPFNFHNITSRSLPPVAYIDATPPSLMYPSFNIDRITNAFELTQMLINIGHTSIAQIAGPPSTATNDFTLGYQQALQRNNLSISEELMIFSLPTIEGGISAFKELMRKKEKPTAILCHFDQQGFGVAQQAKKMGYNIPSRLSLICCSKSLFSDLSVPPLTSYVQPYEELGSSALKQAVNFLNTGETMSKSNLYKGKLVSQKSTTHLISEKD